MEKVGLSSGALEVIGTTRCEILRDLWAISSKELFVLIGLNTEQINEVLNLMVVASKSLGFRFKRHILRCRYTIYLNQGKLVNDLK